MKIAVVIAGLARSLDHCLPTVEQNTTTVLRHTPGIEVTQLLILSHSATPLNDERTGENLPATVNFELVGSRRATLFLLEDLRRESAPLYDFALQRGEWLGGSGRNLRNYLEFLTVLKKAGESLADQDADVVIFVRPDVLVLDRFIPIPGLTLSREAVLTPQWGRFQGLNDRMAVIPQRFVQQYFSRITGVKEFIEQNGSFDPEKHLAWSLRQVPSRSSLSTELVRVRAGGVLAEKDLERLETSGPYRRAQARKLRQTYPAR